MSALPVPLITNHLLQLSTPNERHILLQHCEVVELQFADTLCEPNQPYRYLYFPLSGQFYLTHQFLAGMLGVRRSGVTVAAGIMQQQKLICYSRGVVSILDRTALKNIACECYQAGLDDYRNRLGEPQAEPSFRQLSAQGTP